MNAFRIPGLLVVVGLLVGAVTLDQSRAAPDVIEQAIPLPGAAVAPDDARSSTWFCAAATATEDGLADSEVVLANTRFVDSTATVSVFIGTAEPTVDAPVDELVIPLPAQSLTSLRLADLAPDSEIVSVAVEVDSGGVLVDKISSGPTGVARSACVIDGSSEWVITSGSTLPGSRLQLVVFNPFPDDAVVDIDFVSEVGARSPEDLIALHVPAQSSRVLEIGDVVAASESITTFVRVRSGRVIAEGVQSFDGSDTPLGLSVLTGAPATAETWTFAGVSPAAGPARLVIVNPSETRVRADVEVYPAGAERFVEPFEVILQPGQRDIVDLVSAGRLAGISSFSLVVRSLDGPRIVAGMEQRPEVGEPDPFDAIIEAEVDVPSTGYASSVGQAAAAATLITTVDIAADDVRSALHVFNPAEDTFVTIRATILVDGASRDVTLEVGPQRTARVLLSELGSGRFTLKLNASGPLVATREITGLSSRSWAPLLPALSASN
jgi:hypothetical protein